MSTEFANLLLASSYCYYQIRCFALKETKYQNKDFIEVLNGHMVRKQTTHTDSHEKN